MQQTTFRIADAKVWHALRKPERMRLFEAVRSSGGCSAQQLAVRVGMSSPLTHYHLKLLAAAGLLQNAKGKRYRGKGGMFTRMGNIAAELGLVNLCTTGLGARCIMIGTLTAGQFGVFDVVMNAVGAKKFHFHDPSHH